MHSIDPGLVRQLVKGESEGFQDVSPAHQFLHNELSGLNSPRSSHPQVSTDPEHVLNYVQQLIRFIQSTAF
jgi:hypothetical protein